ncbi:hypothetical protein C7999DRAFT_30331 [Corynascus novoguineensis]|uniref:Uncharacterized protein n=1 Tax=Corynascus novoguineensis TaxID=1126955 RepID=A0AAN7CWD2_9PEZI|nr:hypothetical protein C7999DRAFT_30331 [Corynascus novoguineensis]
MRVASLATQEFSWELVDPELLKDYVPPDGPALQPQYDGNLPGAPFQPEGSSISPKLAPSLAYNYHQPHHGTENVLLLAAPAQNQASDRFSGNRDQWVGDAGATPGSDQQQLHNTYSAGSFPKVGISAFREDPMSSGITSSINHSFYFATQNVSYHSSGFTGSAWHNRDIYNTDDASFLLNEFGGATPRAAAPPSLVTPLPLQHSVADAQPLSQSTKQPITQTDLNPGNLLVLPESARIPNSPRAAVIDLEQILLSDEEIGKRPPGRRLKGDDPVPPNVDPRYWYKCYNRADSVYANKLSRVGAKAAIETGKTRQLAYELLARDVAGSLTAGPARSGKRGEERAEKNKWLRVASLTWNADTQIVRHLSKRGIVLARSDWGAVDSPPLRDDCAAGPDLQFHWTTNVLR